MEEMTIDDIGYIVPRVPEYKLTHENHSMNNSFLMNPTNCWNKIIGYRESQDTKFGRKDCICVLFEKEDFTTYWTHISKHHLICWEDFKKWKK